MAKAAGKTLVCTAPGALSRSVEGTLTPKLDAVQARLGVSQATGDRVVSTATRLAACWSPSCNACRFAFHSSKSEQQQVVGPRAHHPWRCSWPHWHCTRRSPRGYTVPTSLVRRRCAAQHPCWCKPTPRFAEASPRRLMLLVVVRLVLAPLVPRRRCAVQHPCRCKLTPGFAPASPRRLMLLVVVRLVLAPLVPRRRCAVQHP